MKVSVIIRAQVEPKPKSLVSWGQKVKTTNSKNISKLVFEKDAKLNKLVNSKNP